MPKLKSASQKSQKLKSASRAISLILSAASNLPNKQILKTKSEKKDEERQLLSASLIQKLAKITLQNHSKRQSSKHSSHETNLRNKSQLQRLFETDFKERSTQIIKKLKHQLKDFYCFNHASEQNQQATQQKQIGQTSKIIPQKNKTSEVSSNKETNSIMNTNTNKSKELSQQNYPENKRNLNKKSQLSQIIKRDMTIFVNIFAMYSQMVYYSKGEIIEVTGRKKHKIRILVQGDVAIYEPTNKTSLKNSIKKFMIKKKQDKPDYVFQHYNDIAKKIAEKKYTPPQNKYKDLSQQTKIDRKNEIMIFESDEQYPKNEASEVKQDRNSSAVINQQYLLKMLNPQKRASLTQNQSKQIITFFHVNSPITPHKITSIVSSQGHLITSIQTQSIFTQCISDSLQKISTFTAVCLSNQCVLIELEHSVYKQILNLINNNQQKPYISCMMKKFESLTYFDVRQYIKKQGSMIDYLKNEKKERYQSLMQSKEQEEKERIKNIYDDTRKQVEIMDERKDKIIKQKFQKLNYDQIQPKIYKKEELNQSLHVSDPQQPQNILHKELSQIQVKYHSSIHEHRHQIKHQHKQNHQNILASIVKPLHKQTIEQYLHGHHHNQNHQIPTNSPQKAHPNNTSNISSNPNYSNIQNISELNKQRQNEKLSGIQLLKHESSSLYYQLPYRNQPYLIVQGQVIIVINKISQYKLLDPKYSSPRKIFTKHQLLKLYTNDIFGIEDIGQEKQYCLRYQVRKNSKILKMDSKTIRKQFFNISQFKQQFLEIKLNRDQIINQILSKISERLEKQMIKKYSNHANIKTQKYNQIKEKEKEKSNDQFVQQLRKKNESYLSMHNGEQSDYQTQDYWNRNVMSGKRYSKPDIFSKNNINAKRLSINEASLKALSKNATNIEEIPKTPQRINSSILPAINKTPQRINSTNQLKSQQYRRSLINLQRSSLYQHSPSFLNSHSRSHSNSPSPSQSIQKSISNLKPTNKLQLRKVQFIGNKLLPQLQKQILEQLNKKQKQRFKSNTQRLTVELLRQFNLVDFKEQFKHISPQKQVKSTFVQMRDPKNGVLLRRKSIPSFEQVMASKNHKTLQNLIMRKIGLLSQSQRAKHNYKVVTGRKSEIKYQNRDQQERKQFTRLRNISKSVPKLQNFYSKKADIQYNSLKKKKFTL